MLQTQISGENTSDWTPIENRQSNFQQESEQGVSDVVMGDDPVVDDFNMYQNAGTGENQGLESSYMVGVNDDSTDLDFNSGIENTQMEAFEM